MGGSNKIPSKGLVLFATCEIIIGIMAVICLILFVLVGGWSFYMGLTHSRQEYDLGGLLGIFGVFISLPLCLLWPLGIGLLKLNYKARKWSIYLALFTILSFLIPFLFGWGYITPAFHVISRLTNLVDTLTNVWELLVLLFFLFIFVLPVFNLIFLIRKSIKAEFAGES